MNDRACGDLLAVDPSVLKPGIALFRGGKLVSAERVKLDPDYKHLPHGERCLRVAADLVRWGMAHNMEPRTLVFEWPQIYRAAKSKGDPNDLIPLSGVGMALAGLLAVSLIQRSISLVVLTPTPAEWIGQLPKSTTGLPWASPRGARIKSRLDHSEYLAVVPSHDAIDAVGIGLHALGRLSLVRVFAGAADPTTPDAGDV